MTKLLCDEHLGRLARYLRMLGIDTALAAGLDDDELLRRAAAEDRLVLTRDRGLVARSAGRARFVQAIEPRAQLAEVRAVYGLDSQVAPLTRCLDCNVPIVDASPADIARVPEGVRREHGEFWTCPGCSKVFWCGSHYRRMQDFIQALTPSE
jgi:uncharacterized protein with PIN domain